MGDRLRNGVFCCSVDDRIIFLDLETGRYSATPGQIAGARGIDRDNDQRTMGEVKIENLATRDLLAHFGHRTLNPPTSSIAVTDSLLDRHWGTSVWPKVATIAALGLTAFYIKTHSLASLLTRLSERQRGLPEVSTISPAIESAALQFASARLVLPLRDRCLAESASLVAYLAAIGIRSSLVFGVTGRPFAAHCWVQIGHTVLNDTAEHVSAFQPILYA